MDFLVALGALFALATPFLVHVMAAEAYSWFPRWASRLVRFHASRLPERLRDRMSEEWQALLDETPGNLAKLLFAIDLFRAIPPLSHASNYPGVPYKPVFDRLTRGFDILTAAYGLLVGLPLIAIAIGAVKIDSKGPVFARSRRIGQHKREFVLYKFRTLSACDSEKCGVEHPHHVTRVGSLLRRLRFDELPQLLNILLGQMSLIGPRPIQPELVAFLSPIPPAIFSVRPGLTGRAQVSGIQPSGTIKVYWEERVALDIVYVMSRGPVEHMSIIAASIRISLFSGR